MEAAACSTPSASWLSSSGANNGLIGNSHGMIRQRSPHAGPYRSAHVVKHFGGGGSQQESPHRAVAMRSQHY